MLSQSVCLPAEASSLQRSEHYGGNEARARN
jgi:hypothetical protein